MPPLGIWSFYLPLVTLLIFTLWMLRVTWRARALLRRTDQEIEQLERVLADLKARAGFGERSERWLGDVYAYVTRGSFVGNNPLVELINRVYAMSTLVSPELYAALASIKEREMDKLEPARETPGSLLLLGIMGTVVGMVVALSTFGVAGFLGDEGAIDIGRIMGSMFVAFISTGVALFLSVSTRGYLEKVAARQADMLSEMESYAFTHLAPALLPKQDAALQERFLELMERQQMMFDETMTRSTAALETFSETLERAQRLTHAMSESFARNAAAVEGTGQRVGQDLQAFGAGISSKLLGALEDIGEELDKQRGGLEAIYRDTLTAAQEERRAGLQRLEVVQRGTAETMSTLKETSRELNANLSAVTRQLGGYAQQQTAIMEALRRDVAQLSERLVDAQERHQQTLLQTMQSFLQQQFDELARSLGLRRR